ncbi:hypothetical protein EGW08_020314 [Elysia chlorotica]|uniref:Uncharacterized protein n=1 Tax=Elysia chlorotica TaxID=188477 RepID=A0A3S1BPU6_ELYCH|nr:hypothetical protein EGW08_020314 [Elysia chlorotica]
MGNLGDVKQSSSTGLLAGRQISEGLNAAETTLSNELNSSTAAQDVPVSMATTLSATYTLNSAVGTLPPEMFTPSRDPSPVPASALEKTRQRQSQRLAAATTTTTTTHRIPSPSNTRVHASLLFKPESQHTKEMPKPEGRFMRRLGVNNDGGAQHKGPPEISGDDVLGRRSETDSGFGAGRDSTGIVNPRRGTEYQPENTTGTREDGRIVLKRIRREAKVGDVPSFIEPQYCLIIVSKY